MNELRVMARQLSKDVSPGFRELTAEEAEEVSGADCDALTLTPKEIIQDTWDA